MQRSWRRYDACDVLRLRLREGVAILSSTNHVLVVVVVMVVVVVVLAVVVIARTAT